MLPNDVFRCHGTTAPICLDCKRRMQIEHDRDNAGPCRKPYQQLFPVDNQCEFKIGG